MMPPSTGEITHDIPIWPILCQYTSEKAALLCWLMPSATDAPTMPPMMEWVVETGSPLYEANSSHKAAAISALIITKTNCIGWMSIIDKSTMPLLMVSVTSLPAISAPLTSNRAATISAWVMESVPAPTEVPKELATSLPPILKAMNRPKAQARMKTKG